MKVVPYLNCLVLSLLMTSMLYGQDDHIIIADQILPQALTDQTITQRLQSDWNKRNSRIRNVSVMWYELGDGFYGSYTINNQNHMILYDVEGNYVETLKKSTWNSKVSNILKSSFKLSNYNTQEVISYWEVSDPNRKGYYMEVKDVQGKISRIWANEKGDFSSSIPKAKY